MRVDPKVPIYVDVDDSESRSKYIIFRDPERCSSLHRPILHKLKYLMQYGYPEIIYKSYTIYWH